MSPEEHIVGEFEAAVRERARYGAPSMSRRPIDDKVDAARAALFSLLRAAGETKPVAPVAWMSQDEWGRIERAAERAARGGVKAVAGYIIVHPGLCYEDARPLYLGPIAAREDAP